MRYALRSLLKARGFTVVAIVILALGIGSTTAVFSIVDAVLIRPLPFTDPHRLFVLVGANPKRGMAGAAFSYPAYTELASRQQSFSGVSAFASDRLTLTGIERPEQLPAARVSAGFFDVLGVTPSAGRVFRPEDDRPDSRVIVIGRRFWMRQFNGEPRAIGSALTLNGRSTVIIGALAQELPPPFADVDVWALRPDEVSGFTPSQVAGGLGYLSAVGRLGDGIGRERAQAEMDAIAQSYARAHPTNTDADPDATLRLIPLRDESVGAVQSPLLLLAAAVALVLVAACANVANLFLVRGAARAHEAAIRIALGASRGDVARWLGAESLLLAAAGGAAGVLAASWTVDLARVFLVGLPRGADVAVDARALIFSLAVSIVSGLVFALAPWRRLTRAEPGDTLRSASCPM